jgi:hypothetical protein
MFHVPLDVLWPFRSITNRESASGAYIALADGPPPFKTTSTSSYQSNHQSRASERERGALMRVFAGWHAVLRKA